MTRHDAFAALHAHADAVRAMGATTLYLFGSTAADQATATSDLDIYIEYDTANRFNAFDLVGIKQFIEDRLGSSVDITTRDRLHPRLRDGIEQSALRVF